MFDDLIEGFRYDLWANRQWLSFLDERGRPDPDWDILRHILAAQEIWLRRCHGESLPAMPKPEVSEETLSMLSEEWIDLLGPTAGDRRVDYRNTQGVPYSQRLSRIARHVVNHGTYHRGELRGLCLPREDRDFPETDLIGFFIAHRLTE